MKNALPPASLALLLALCSTAPAQQSPPLPAATPPPAATTPPPAVTAPPAGPSTPSAPPLPTAPAAPPPSAARIAPHKWDVDRVLCSDLLRASDEDRASAAMFYYGYLAAKAGIHVIDVSRVSGNIARVMQLCKERPRLMVPQAFRDALGHRRAR